MQKRGLPELAAVWMESGTSVNYFGINLMTVTLAFSLLASRIIRLGPFNVDNEKVGCIYLATRFSIY